MTIVIITVVVVSGFLYWHNDQQHRQDFIRNNLILVKLVGEFTILPLVFEDNEGAKEHISKLLQDPNIVYVRLKNSADRIMVDYDPSNIADSAPSLDVTQESIWLHDRLYFSISINRNNQNLGVLTGAFRVDEYKQVQYRELVFIIAAVLAAMVCSLIMALLLRRFVMSSIQQLEKHARRIAKNPGSDESIAYPNRRNDEISQLYEAFNLLMKRVRNREAEILRLNANLESKIKQRTADLSAALKIKSAFLANMSHEIRTPMNAILGMHELILETELTPKQFNYLAKANNAAKWLLGIINDVLDVSKLEAGKIQLEQMDFRLEAVIQYLEDVAKSLLNDKRIALQFSLDPTIPKTLVGDQLRIGQVLLNLISNAIKFTEFGAITIQIQLLHATSKQVILRFSVSDMGIGISEEQQQNLFKAFTQADSSTTRRFGGTGLGLVICKDLVEAMGGTIHLKSQLGAGSCFSFSIALGISNQSSPDLELTAQALTNQTSIIKGMQVLLVEDNKVNQELMLEVLGNHGLKVDLACNGAEAISMVEENHYDAVLMDCQMPVMDGFIATRTLRANPRFTDLPIIAMTANVMAEDKERCLACGMNDHVGKPIDWHQLFQTLEFWVGEKSSAERTKNDLNSEMIPAKLEFPTLTAVDLKLAQNIVSGNVDLYLKLLALVRTKHLNGMLSINSAYQGGDHQSAALQAHTLSGTLSSIGAIQLSGLMKTLQDKFNQGQDNAAIQALLQQAEIEFNTLMNEIDQICR